MTETIAFIGFGGAGLWPLVKLVNDILCVPPTRSGAALRTRWSRIVFPTSPSP
jgi:hypothetical protein